VRKEPKPHGLKKFIEGDVKSGDRVIIVDDVITSGKSTIEAMEKCQDAGLKILKAIALIDRQEEGGKENIEQHEVTLETLFTLQDFKDRLNER
jgi:orotate phosphoribosyltransferase